MNNCIGIHPKPIEKCFFNAEEEPSVVFSACNSGSNVRFTLKNGKLSTSVYFPNSGLQSLSAYQIKGLDMSHIFTSIKDAQKYLNSFWYKLNGYGRNVSLTANVKLLGGMHDENGKVLADLHRKWVVENDPSGKAYISNESCPVEINGVTIFYRSCTQDEYDDFWKRGGAPNNGYLSPTLEYSASIDNAILIEIEFTTRNDVLQTLPICYQELSNNASWGRKGEGGKVMSIEINPSVNQNSGEQFSRKFLEWGFRALPEECKNNNIQDRRSLLSWLLEEGVFRMNVKLIGRIHA